MTSGDACFRNNERKRRFECTGNTILEAIRIQQRLNRDISDLFDSAIEHTLTLPPEQGKLFLRDIAYTFQNDKYLDEFIICRDILLNSRDILSSSADFTISIDGLHTLQKYLPSIAHNYNLNLEPAGRGFISGVKIYWGDQDSQRVKFYYYQDDDNVVFRKSLNVPIKNESEVNSQIIKLQEIPPFEFDYRTRTMVSFKKKC